MDINTIMFLLLGATQDGRDTRTEQELDAIKGIRLLIDEKRLAGYSTSDIMADLNDLHSDDMHIEGLKYLINTLSQDIIGLLE